MMQIAFVRFVLAEPLCAENNVLKDIAQSCRGGTNFSEGPNNVLQNGLFTAYLLYEEVMSV